MVKIDILKIFIQERPEINTLGRQVEIIGPVPFFAHNFSMPYDV
jgi:hypothetical protein